MSPTIFGLLSLVVTLHFGEIGVAKASPNSFCSFISSPLFLPLAVHAGQKTNLRVGFRFKPSDFDGAFELVAIDQDGKSSTVFKSASMCLAQKFADGHEACQNSRGARSLEVPVEFSKVGIVTLRLRARGDNDWIYSEPKKLEVVASEQPTEVYRYASNKTYSDEKGGEYVADMVTVTPKPGVKFDRIKDIANSVGMDVVGRVGLSNSAWQLKSRKDPGPGGVLELIKKLKKFNEIEDAEVDGVDTVQ